MSVLALAFLGIFVSQEAEKMWGAKDPSCIVIDEIVGFQCTMFLIAPTVAHIAVGFVLFRIFDIVKPFPIRVVEKRIPGGYGVVGDDVIAGIYSNILLLALVKFAGI
jgi:phosphatidylglycerophosphatase A